MTATGRVILALGLVLALASAARAQVQECHTDCDRYESGQCVAYVQRCVTTEPPRPSFGAIAYGKSDGSWGSSFHWSTRQKAESVALDNCRKQGADDCEVAVWFDRRCGAISSTGGSEIFWAIGEAEGEARGNALRKCGSKACEVLASACSR
jgi:uncharacterized protein DUF4189